VFIIFLDRKARSTYLHIHLKAALSSVGGVRMFFNSISLLMHFKLLFTPWEWNRSLLWEHWLLQTALSKTFRSAK